MVRVLDYYQPSGSIQISGKTLAGTSVNIIGGQASIDVTGKAHNVLKRIQVRVPSGLNALNFQGPIDAAVGQNICKREQTDPIAGTTYAGAVSGDDTACSFGGDLLP